MALAITPAVTRSYIQGDIQIGHIWTSVTPSGATTASEYVLHMNVDKEPDKLLGASTDFADKVAIHQDTNENNKPGESHKASYSLTSLIAVG